MWESKEDGQGGFDALGGCHGEERLGYASAETCEDCSGARELAVLVGEEGFVLIECDESCG